MKLEAMTKKELKIFSLGKDTLRKELCHIVKYYYPSELKKKFKFTYWPIGTYYMSALKKDLKTITIPANDIEDARFIFGLIVECDQLHEITELT